MAVSLEKHAFERLSDKGKLSALYFNLSHLMGLKIGRRLQQLEYEVDVLKANK